MRSIGRKYGERPVIGVFHSLSALTALLHEEHYRGFSALVLFDLPIQHPGGKPEDWLELGERMAASARRKQYRFESREELANLFGEIPSYGKVLPGVLDLIAATTLQGAEDGAGYELCCPREYEAQIYEFLFGWAMQIDLRNISCPVKVIGSDSTVRFSFLPSSDLSDLIGLDYDFLPDLTHFLQLEDPEQCVAMTIEFLESQSLI